MKYLVTILIYQAGMWEYVNILQFLHQRVYLAIISLGHDL